MASAGLAPERLSFALEDIAGDDDANDDIDSQCADGAATNRVYRRKQAAEDVCHRHVFHPKPRPVDPSSGSVEALPPPLRREDEPVEPSGGWDVVFRDLRGGTSALLEVHRDSILGRGIFARSAIPAGTELITTVPYAWSLDAEHASSNCHHCLSGSANLKRCTACRVRFFLSRDPSHCLSSECSSRIFDRIHGPVVGSLLRCSMSACSVVGAPQS